MFVQAVVATALVFRFGNWFANQLVEFVDIESAREWKDIVEYQNRWEDQYGR